MKPVNSLPCYKCNDRLPGGGCHSNCDKYKQWNKLHQAMLEKIKRSKEYNNYVKDNELSKSKAIRNQSRTRNSRRGS